MTCENCGAPAFPRYSLCYPCLAESVRKYNTERWIELARRMNAATSEQVAQALERVPTDALEWGVRFEALGQSGGKK